MTILQDKGILLTGIATNHAADRKVSIIIKDRNSYLLLIMHIGSPRWFPKGSALDHLNAELGIEWEQKF